MWPLATCTVAVCFTMSVWWHFQWLHWWWYLPSVLWHCWLGDRKGIRPAKKTELWGAGVAICLERGADLHMAQLMPLPLTVSCFSKIQICFAFLVPAHPGSPGWMAAERVCVRRWREMRVSCRFFCLSRATLTATTYCCCHCTISTTSSNTRSVAITAQPWRYMDWLTVFEVLHIWICITRSAVITTQPWGTHTDWQCLKSCICEYA